MNIITALQIAASVFREARKYRAELSKLDGKTDTIRNELLRRILKREEDKTSVQRDRANATFKPHETAGQVLLILLLALYVSGCASVSVRQSRAAGGHPTFRERVILNWCDGVSWVEGVLPFGEGDD